MRIYFKFVRCHILLWIVKFVRTHKLKYSYIYIIICSESWGFAGVAFVMAKVKFRIS